MGPFPIENVADYIQWRDEKLASQPTSASNLLVEINNPHSLSRNERDAIGRRLARSNMAIYVCRSFEKSSDEDIRQHVLAFAAQFGLVNIDMHLCAGNERGVTPLSNVKKGERQRYIPYTNRPINWHTDGYYNESNKQIRAFLLHCVSEAYAGGESGFIDPEIVYIRLREKNPDFVSSLSQKNTMTIPANEEMQQEIRREISGPVFSYDDCGNLHTRFTARTQSIHWHNDELTTQAVRFLKEILNSSDVITHRLIAGQGVICNNVLHCRREFRDNDTHNTQQRLVYRARFFDRASVKFALQSNRL